MNEAQFFPLTLPQLFQCVGLGIVVGLLFDLLTGCGRCLKSRWVSFVLDALFGPIAAVVTFFGALVICDGILHPVLFAGVLAGFLSEHILIGKWLSKGIVLLHRGVAAAFKTIVHWVCISISKCKSGVSKVLNAKKRVDFS